MKKFKFHKPCWIAICCDFTTTIDLCRLPFPLWILIWVRLPYMNLILLFHGFISTKNRKHLTLVLILVLMSSVSLFTLSVLFPPLSSMEVSEIGFQLRSTLSTLKLSWFCYDFVYSFTRVLFRVFLLNLYHI